MFGEFLFRVVRVWLRRRSNDERRGRRGRGVVFLGFGRFCFIRGIFRGYCVFGWRFLFILVIFGRFFCVII